MDDKEMGRTSVIHSKEIPVQQHTGALTEDREIQSAENHYLRKRGENEQMEIGKG